MIYLQLFLSFVQVGLFSVGGGYAAMPLIQHQVVELHHWLSMETFTDVITISQMTPGPIAINSATFVGVQVGGTAGAVVATLGCVLPSIVLMLLLGYFYNKYSDLSVIQGILSGLRPAVIALIGTAGISIIKLALWKEGIVKYNNIDFVAVGIFLISFLCLRKWKADPTKVMLIAGILGGIVYVCTNNG